MKRHRVLAGSAVALVLLIGGATSRAVAGQTPTLGDVAKKEAERRKTQPAPAGKVYTNKDLPESALKPATSTATPPSEETAASDPVAVATGQKAADTKAADNKPQAPKDEASWKKRMADAREDLRRSEMFAEALQTRVNTLNKDFSSRDNPAQRARIGEDRTEALNELTRVKGEVERAKKQISDIEEEARKAGVPAGWLR